jgi:hypothetical protein
MAQTKRKRRSKHRGNAAGTVEARGRTGRKPTADERKKPSTQDVRAERRFAEPTWTGAMTRAGLASVMLLVLFQVGLAGQKQNIFASLALAIGAFVIYVPLGYKVDRVFWERRMRKAGRPIQPRAPRRATKGR